MRKNVSLTLSGDELWKASGVEWLETNGTGGYASSTVSGAHSRRYHGLLVAAHEESLRRDVLLSRLDETLIVREEHIELATRVYRDVTVPDGRKYLTHFEQQWNPSFLWASHEREWELSKSVLMLHGEDTLLVRYEAKQCPKNTILRLEPFLANRFFHALQKAHNPPMNSLDWDGRRLLVVLEEPLPSYAIVLPEGIFCEAPEWYHQFFYSHEEERGQESVEDLYRIGWFEFSLKEGTPLYLAISTEHERWEERSLSLLWNKEIARRKGIVREKDSSFACHLSLAADAFCIRQRGEQESMIAGYHWFGAWGRDTMISLPGISRLVDGEARVKALLTTFAAYIHDGLIPNRFADRDGAAEYNSVDASLWFIVNGYRCLRDRQYLQSYFLPAAETILQAFSRGTQFHIYEDRDGLLCAGGEHEQLTWMDARVGDWVVTPRHGKPVEVNALWCNAYFCIGSIFQTLGEKKRGESYLQKAERIREAFVQSFWNEEEKGLYDVIMESSVDSAIRPNQIFALSLPFPLLDEGKALCVLQLVERDLLTPRGLRTLSPKDPNYQGAYQGGVLARDGAYHQGTVWPWLLGAYARAVIRYGTEEMQCRARDVVFGLEEHLLEDGIGTISEIFDGDFPHASRGAIAQAWSVFEALVAIELLTGVIC